MPHVSEMARLLEMLKDISSDMFWSIKAIVLTMLTSLLANLSHLSVSQILFSYIFYYPLFMAYIWIFGALYYYFHYERKDLKIKHQPSLKNYPSVSILVPCYNEEDNAQEVITHLMHMNYPDYEVIAINDGSKDRTGAILDALAA